jgi:hypothetical protein
MKKGTFSRRAALIFATVATSISLLACALGASGESPTTTGTAPNPRNQPIMYKGKPVVAKVDTILDVRGTSTLSDGSLGLVRFTSQIHTWSQAVTAPAGKQNAPLAGLAIIITTGNDDLRAGSSADVVVHYATAGDVTFKNVNTLHQWNAGDEREMFLMPVPSSTLVGDIQTISIVTAFPGGVTGDNWDISGVTLVVVYLA